MSNIPVLKPQEVVRILENLGFVEVRQKGSHKQFRHIDPTKLRELIDRLETIAGIQQGFEELNAGLTRPIGNFIREMEQKYDI